VQIVGGDIRGGAKGRETERRDDSEGGRGKGRDSNEGGRMGVKWRERRGASAGKR
jgi:hypothetical protein